VTAPDRSAAFALVDEVLAAARKAAPGAEVLVSVSSGREANTRFARNEITSTGDVAETRVRIEVAHGKRHAATTTNQTDPGSLRAAAEHASRIAKVSPEDPEWVSVLGPQQHPAAAPSYDASTEALTAEARAGAAAGAIRAAEAEKLQVAGFYEHSSRAWALGSTAGMRAYHLSTAAEFTTTARTAEGTGSGWAGAASFRARDIDTDGLVGVSIGKALRSAQPRRLPPGRYTVILEPAAVAELLSFLVGMLDARRADEGRSFFSNKGGGTRIGQALFNGKITLGSDPSDPETPGAPFDDEGSPLTPVTWIDRGRVTALRYSRHWAKKQGKAATGTPSVYKLKGGGASPEGLLKGVKKGVLITRFWYCRSVDPQSMLVTGLTRDGVFLVEDGALSAPVNNFRFNESPAVMLQNATALSRETVRSTTGRARMRVPALRTEAFHLASVSDAV
jgi:predicted Zn-dependent protease